MPNNPYHNWKHVVDVTQVQALLSEPSLTPFHSTSVYRLCCGHSFGD